jgi:hypothetical protein
MRIMKRNRGLGTFCAAAVGVLALAGVASAADYWNVTSERSGSMIVFPKIVNTDGRDTIIRVANTSNPLAFVHCFYVSGDYCAETDFDLILTKQQPTHWSASSGRRISLNPYDWGTDATGLPPGLIPPVPPGFEGQLICIQVDPEGFPYPGNALKGDAVLRSSDGDVALYNAFSFPAESTDTDPGDGITLSLNRTPNEGGEYTACPDTLLLNHFTEGSPDRVAVQAAEGWGSSCEWEQGGNCSISTELTLVPCSLDLENQRGASESLHVFVYNEYEQQFSANINFTCWFNKTLNEINPTAFGWDSLGTLGAYSRITPNENFGGVIAVAEETRQYGDGIVGRAIFNVHGEGNQFDQKTDGTCPSAPNPDACKVPGYLDQIQIPTFGQLF